MDHLRKEIHSPRRWAPRKHTSSKSPTLPSPADAQRWPQRLWAPPSPFDPRANRQLCCLLLFFCLRATLYSDIKQAEDVATNNFARTSGATRRAAWHGRRFTMPAWTMTSVHPASSLQKRCAASTSTTHAMGRAAMCRDVGDVRGATQDVQSTLARTAMAMEVTWALYPSPRDVHEQAPTARLRMRTEPKMVASDERACMKSRTHEKQMRHQK